MACATLFFLHKVIEIIIWWLHRCVNDVSSNPRFQRPSDATQLADCHYISAEETLNQIRIPDGIRTWVPCSTVQRFTAKWWLNSSKTNFRPWQKFQIKCAWFLTLSWRAKIWSIGLKYPKTTQSKGPTWSAEVGKLWDTLIIIYIHSLDTHYELTLSICSEIDTISIQMDSFESIFYFFLTGV